MFTLLWIDIVSCTDLYGLVLFLGVDPYWVKHWWYQLLYRPYRRGNTEPLYYVIAQLLWRSAKKDVIDQVNLWLWTQLLWRISYGQLNWRDVVVEVWLMILSLLSRSRSPLRQRRCTGWTSPPSRVTSTTVSTRSAPRTLWSNSGRSLTGASNSAASTAAPSTPSCARCWGCAKLAAIRRPWGGSSCLCRKGRWPFMFSSCS